MGILCSIFIWNLCGCVTSCVRHIEEQGAIALRVVAIHNFDGFVREHVRGVLSVILRGKFMDGAVGPSASVVQPLSLAVEIQKLAIRDTRGLERQLAFVESDTIADIKFQLEELGSGSVDSLHLLEYNEELGHDNPTHYFAELPNEQPVFMLGHVSRQTVLRVAIKVTVHFYPKLARDKTGCDYADVYFESADADTITLLWRCDGAHS